MRRSFEANKVAILMHALPSSVALATGALQFFKQLRIDRPLLHRVCGYTYLLMVAVGSIAGAIMRFSVISHCDFDVLTQNSHRIYLSLFAHH
jgi:hypothetical protein